VIRRISVAAALYVLLLIAGRLVPHGGDTAGAIDPTSLISYGFLVIAAFTAGDIAAKLGVPRITAYFLTGLLAGPDNTALIQRELLGAVHYFGSGSHVLPLTLLALCLMGLRAGAAIRVGEYTRPEQHFAGRITVQIGLILVVTAGFVMAALAMDIAAGSPTDILAVSIVLSTLAVGGSPAAAVGVLDETGSRGPIGQLALGDAAIRELVAPILFVIALATVGDDLGARPPGFALIPWIAIIFGTLSGLLLLAVRWINGHDTPLLTLTLIFVVGLIFATADPTGPLLLFLVAGVVLANSHRQGARVLTSLGRFATPVYVFFFATLGVAYPLAESTGALALGGTLAVGRVAALYLSGVVNARVSGSTLELSGLAHVPHAGVSVCLALVAAELLPDWGPIIRDAALGAILVAELAGPLVLQTLLARAGEYATGPSDDAVPLTPFEQLVEVGAELPAPPDTLDDAIAAPLRHLQNRVQGAMDDFSDGLGAALTTGPFRYLSDLPPPSDPPDRSADLRTWADHTARYSGEARALDTLQHAVDGLITTLTEAVDALRPTSIPETADDRRAKADDSRLCRLIKLNQRALAVLGLRRRARRVVRLDHLARYHLTGPLAGRLVPITNLAMRAAVIPFAEIRRRVSDDTGLHAPDPAALQTLQELGDDVLARAMLLFADAMDAIYADADIAGTPSLPARRVNPSRRFEEARVGRQRLDEAATRWRDTTAGEAGRLLAMIHVEIAHQPVEAAFGAAASATDTLIARALERPLTQLKQDTGVALAGLNDAMRAEHVRDRTEAIIERRDSLQMLHQTLTRGIDTSNNRGDFSGFLGALWAALGGIADATPERLSVPSEHAELPAEGLTPSARQASLSRLPVRDVVRTALVDDGTIALMEVEEGVTAVVERARASLTHAAQVSRFHLDAAAAELTEKTDGDGTELASEFALGGLTRVAEQLTEDLEQLAADRIQLARRVDREGSAALDRLRHLLVTGTAAQAEIYAARRRTAPPQSQTTAETEDQKLSVVESVVRRIREQLTPAGPEATPADGFPFRTATRATLEHAASLGLPETYRRLFNFNPVGLDDFFVGRQAEYTALTNAVQRWRRGSPTALMLTGPRGCGRTTVVDRLLRNLPAGVSHRRVHLTRRAATERALVREIGQSLGFKRLSSVKRLLEHLITQSEPIVFVIEPLGRLHLRSRHGLGALRTLSRIVSATAHRVLWVVISDPTALKAMCALVEIQSVFTDTVTMSEMTTAEIESLIEVRNRAGGYRVRFQPPSSGGAASQAELRARYFATLAERAHGQPLLAVYQWLRSLRLDTSGKVLVVEEPRQLDLSYVEEMSETDLLMAAQVHVHAGLSVQEVSQVTSLPREGSAGVIRRLAWRHFLETPEPERYVINPILWPELSRALRQKGVL